MLLYKSPLFTTCKMWSDLIIAKTSGISKYIKIIISDMLEKSN